MSLLLSNATSSNTLELPSNAQIAAKEYYHTYINSISLLLVYYYCYNIMYYTYIYTLLLSYCRAPLRRGAESRGLAPVQGQPGRLVDDLLMYIYIYIYTQLTSSHPALPPFSLAAAVTRAELYGEDRLKCPHD